MHVTLGEEGSCVSAAAEEEDGLLFLKKSGRLALDLGRVLLLPTLVLKNLINGGGNFAAAVAALPGLVMGFDDDDVSFIPLPSLFVEVFSLLFLQLKKCERSGK